MNIEETLKRAAQGYRNLMEFALVPAQHIPTTLKLAEQCEECLEPLRRIIQERDAAVRRLDLLRFSITWPSGEQVSVEEGIATAKGCVGKGWAGILERLILDLLRLGWDGNLGQVKEKFGGLRFYIGSGSEAVWKRVDQAERESFETCEKCGQPGKPEGRWVQTLCDTCRAVTA